jgi:hypothetical protein
MPERKQPIPLQEPVRKPNDGDDGPRNPDVEKPDTRRLLERMKRVDPRQAERYRQRSGQ